MKWLRVGLASGIVLALAGLWWWGLRQAKQARSNGLRADSLAVAADSSRDSLGVILRRAYQLTLKRDSLEKALALRPVLRVPIVVTPDTIRIHDTVAVAEDAQGVREADFAKQGPGWEASGHVALPPPPSPGSVSLLVALAPIPMTARLVCGTPVGGVRPASIGVEGPAWVKLRLGPSQVTPDACNPIRLQPRIGVPVWSLPAVGGLALILGLLLH